MWFVKLMSYFPKAGPMQNILGSPADPIFWASHGAWERLWHYLRIDDHVALGANVSAGTWSTTSASASNQLLTCSCSLSMPPVNHAETQTVKSVTRYSKPMPVSA